MNFVKQIIIIAVIIIIAIGSFFAFSQLFPGSNDQQITTRIDETVIVEKVQDLSRLETVEETIQRDLVIELNLGSLEVFGVKFLENKREQSIAMTGSVVAGVDLSKISAENVEFNPENKTLNMILPAPEIFVVGIDENKTSILRDDLTVLFRLENINDSRRTELNQELLRQVISQSEIALIDGACTNGILETANENAITSVKNLFVFSDLDPENITIKTTQASTCGI